jgi:hypothetical protein
MTCIVCGGRTEVIDEATGHYACDTCGRQNLEGKVVIDAFEQIKIKDRYKALFRRCQSRK